jgi:hypothetical protein
MFFYDYGIALLRCDAKMKGAVHFFYVGKRAGNRYIFTLPLTG